MKRRVLITGASSGIGAAAALEIAKLATPDQPVELILTGRHQARLAKVADKAGGEAMAGDLNDAAFVEALVAKLFEKEGFPVVVNAAGVAAFGPFDQSQFESLTWQMETNFTAPARLIHGCLPSMLRGEGGLFINILSLVAATPLANTEAYTASKTALLALGQCLNLSYRKRGVKVCAILPGAVNTPIWGDGPSPPKGDMLTAAAVGQCIAEVVLSPLDRHYDQIQLNPPKGLL